MLEIASGFVEERRADGGDQLHVHRRPEGEREIQGARAGTGRATILTKHPLQPSEEETAAESGITQRQTARAGNEMLEGEVTRRPWRRCQHFSKDRTQSRRAPHPERRRAACAGRAPSANPFQLRALPQEDVFFYCKKIDNSRLVREADPQVARRLLVARSAPPAWSWRCSDRCRSRRASPPPSPATSWKRCAPKSAVCWMSAACLDLQEAELLSPDRLEKLAQGRTIWSHRRPARYFIWTASADGAVAMVK